MRRRAEILTESASGIVQSAEEQQHRVWPEEAMLQAANRSIISEFESALDELEAQMFVCAAEGMRYRSVATALQIPVNDARRAYRSYERKRSASSSPTTRTGAVAGRRTRGANRPVRSRGVALLGVKTMLLRQRAFRPGR